MLKCVYKADITEQYTYTHAKENNYVVIADVAIKFFKNDFKKLNVLYR